MFVLEFEPVGFTAHASEDREYPSDEIIQFDDVQSNFGGHYNATTCTFLCPDHGIYLFSVHFNAYQGNYMYIEIVRDSTVLGEAMALDRTRDGAYVYYSHASALVIVDCEAGEEVWARSGAVTDSHLLGGSRYSQFSGYLLHRYA